MIRKLFIAACLFLSGIMHAQDATYSIGQVPLPEEMNKQVCISGMTWYNGLLYFASERCPQIFAFDPSTQQIVKTLSLQVPQEFEMEGITNYNGKLYLVSEQLVAVYEVDPQTGTVRTVSTSVPLPPKSKNGDGTEGIASFERHKKIYILRERNNERTQAELYTYTAAADANGQVSLQYESTMTLPLENPQWRYSDICTDTVNNRLVLLKSYSKGKLRQQYLEQIRVDPNGVLVKESLAGINVENFSGISNIYKEEDFSMNLEGIVFDPEGSVYVVSDNTSGKAICAELAKEKTILLQLKKNKPAN